MSLSRAESSKRISNACLPCQKRKIRCDGSHPTCSSCQRREVVCEYAARKTRGPGRSKEYIQMLEEKVQRLQSSLPQEDLPQELGKENSHTNRGLAESSQEMLNSNAQGGASNHIENPDIELLQRKLREPTPNVDLLMRGLSFMSKVDRLYGNVKDVMDNLNSGGFMKTTFTQIIPQMDDPELIVHIIEDINEVYPLITKASLTELLDQQYAAGVENSSENPGRWALLNSYLAMLLQWKVANAHRQQFDPLEWAFFKNAFSVFPELIIRGKDLLSCQGLLFMVMFMQGNGDTWTASHILSTAARLSQSIGLHQKPSAGKHDSRLDQVRSRTFWFLYILDSHEVMKSGLAPCISHDDVCIELPMDDPPDGLGCYSIGEADKSINVFRGRAELAIVQSKVHKRLFSDKASQKNVLERAGTITALHHDLETWRASLPELIQPFFDKEPPTEPEMPVILLHFTYYSCITKLAVAHTRLENDDIPQSVQSTHGDDSLRLATRVDAARATIRLLRYLSDQSFACLWRIICYPIAASLTLLANILIDPLKCAAHTDKSLIGEFINLLEKFQKVERCDVGEVLNGCRRLYEIATAAMSQEILNPTRAERGDHISKEQIDYTRYQLKTHDDHLLLASGLVGNIPSLTEEANKIFSKILAVSEGSGQGFGLFVPDRLKPETFNFSFS